MKKTSVVIVLSFVGYVMAGVSTVLPPTKTLTNPQQSESAPSPSEVSSDQPQSKDLFNSPVGLLLFVKNYFQ